MNITIVNGSNHNPYCKPFDDALEDAVRRISAEHQTDLFTVKNMKLNPCTGCWDCWTKTPGICMHKDDGALYLKSLAHADAFLLFSPLICGFISSDTKKALDRFIPTALPYIRLHKGECHHLPRYRDPKHFGLFIFDDKTNDPAGIELTKAYTNRLNNNIKAEKKWFGLVNPDEMEVRILEIINS